MAIFRGWISHLTTSGPGVVETIFYRVEKLTNRHLTFQEPDPPSGFSRDESREVESRLGAPSRACPRRFEIIDLQPDIPSEEGHLGVSGEGPCSLAFEAGALPLARACAGKKKDWGVGVAILPRRPLGSFW